MHLAGLAPSCGYWQRVAIFLHVISYVLKTPYILLYKLTIQYSYLVLSQLGSVP